MGSANKEKYLLEIYMNVKKEGVARVSQLAKSLGVTTSFASKMVKKLSEEDLIVFQKYSNITLTEKGRKVGQQLSLHRDVLTRFFRKIRMAPGKIEEEVSKIEFCMSREAINKIEAFLEKSNEKI